MRTRTLEPPTTIHVLAEFLVQSLGSANGAAIIRKAHSLLSITSTPYSDESSVAQSTLSGGSLFIMRDTMGPYCCLPSMNTVFAKPAHVLYYVCKAALMHAYTHT